MLNVQNNILKILNFFRLNKDELAAHCGLSRAGFYKTLKEGNFRLQTIEKIAEFIHIPTAILLADEITISEQIGWVADANSIIIRYQTKDVAGFKVEISGKEYFISTINERGGNLQQKEDEVEIITLRTKLREKDDLIEFLKHKNEMLESAAKNFMTITETYEKQLKFYDDLLSGLKEKYEKNNKTKGD